MHLPSLHFEAPNELEANLAIARNAVGALATSSLIILSEVPKNGLLTREFLVSAAAVCFLQAGKNFVSNYQVNNS